MTMRGVALTAIAVAAYFTHGRAAAAYTYTFRLPMTINHVHLNTVSFFCRDVDWYGVVNSGTTLTVNSAGGCLVSRVIIEGKVNGKSMTYNIYTGATPNLTFYDRDGQVCVEVFGQSICRPLFNP